jgi:hypothetical protein
MASSWTFSPGELAADDAARVVTDECSRSGESTKCIHGLRCRATTGKTHFHHSSGDRREQYHRSGEPPGILRD